MESKIGKDSKMVQIDDYSMVEVGPCEYTVWRGEVPIMAVRSYESLTEQWMLHELDRIIHYDKNFKESGALE